ncbi:DUF1573 domain-containing protein [Pontiellaceae bacterium B1224]|nr:DUF1573 domain-containing protein [Pontiellaceae bacterium B1224]
MILFEYLKKNMLLTVLTTLPVLTSTAANGLRIEPKDVLDLGNFAAESNQTATFTLHNTGNETVRIGPVESCCSYLKPIVYERTIAPGGSVAFDALIDANVLSGPFDKTISLSIAETKRQTVTLRVKGNAQPAILVPSSRIYVGHIPLQQGWSTNLVFAMRNGISGTPVTEVRSNQDLTATTGKSNELTFSFPPQSEPRRWQATILLRIEGMPHLPPVPIHLEGCNGGSLHPLPRKLVLSSKNPKATITMHRKLPVAAVPTPLRCSIPTIGITESVGSGDSSTVQLVFPTGFMQRLKAEQRIQIELSAEGCLPAVLTVEYAP